MTTLYMRELFSLSFIARIARVTNLQDAVDEPLLHTRRLSLSVRVPLIQCEARHLGVARTRGVKKSHEYPNPPESMRSSDTKRGAALQCALAVHGALFQMLAS